MSGALIELPSAIPNSSPNSGLGRAAGQGGESSQAASPQTSVGANGGTGLDANPATESGSFSANWQAILASLEGQTGAETLTTTKGSEIADQNSSLLAAAFGGQTGTSGGSPLTAKESAQVSATGTPNAATKAANAAFAQSPDKLARLQQLEAPKSSLNGPVESTAETASSALSSRTNGSQAFRPMHSASASDSSNPAIVPTDAFAANSLQLATLVAGNQNVNSASRFNANSSRPTASTSASASQARSLAVTGAPERSISLAVSDTGPGIAADRRAAVSNATASSSNAVQGSPFLGDGSPNANSNELDPLFAASGSIDGASAAFSAGANQASDVAAASDRKAVSRSNSSADQSVRSARSTQAGQHASSAEPAAWLGPRGASPAQGNPSAATSTITPTVSPLAASASGSGPAPGSNLGSVSYSSNTATAVSPGETFAALDGDASTGSFSWTHVGANRAEAGFEDPALGWVGVRADLGAGSVHAMLVPGSPEAAQMLGSHLAGLNDYLAERHPAVGTVTVAEHENSGSFRNAQSGSGTESGSQSPSQQSSSGNSETNSHMVNPTHNGTRTGSNPISHAGEGNNQALPSNSSLPASSLAAETLGRSSGSRISVMA